MSQPPSIHLPTSPHTHTIIVLHGRSSSAATFHSELFESQDSQDLFFLDLFPSIKWVFPCAPLRFAQIEREHIHQWFDMASVQWPWENVEVQREGLEESAEYLAGIIEEEVRKVGWERVLVGGISQGCAIGVYTLVKKGIRVGGFFGMSGWCPTMGAEIEKEMDDVRDMPVLLQHCKDDGIVPVENGQDLAAQLRKMGFKIRWECFEEGGHWLNEPEGMDGIVQFVNEIRQSCEKN